MTVIQVEKGSVVTASAMKALRAARSLSPAESRCLADQLFGPGIEGTLIEMEVIGRLLREHSKHRKNLQLNARSSA
ncbi:hypothetical protein [Nocardia sp. NPDC051981]|uniref:hypothetical protein n=1 Tax=Nocardia sp. NPDC051981 TaxID=3155417 RepID=UPI00343AA802